VKHFLGLSEYGIKQKKEEYGIFYEPERLINSHMLLCGMSGTGKSYQSLRFLECAARSGIELDVFDVHEELHHLPGAVACKYSQATGYGHNPLVLDTDPHSGGVTRQIDFVVRLIKEVTPQFGAKQEAALRNLLGDVYLASGIYPDNARSWQRQRITERERTAIVEARRYSDLRQYYPTLEDLRSYARRKIIALTIGGDNKCVSAYEELTRLRSRLSSLQSKYAKERKDDEIKKIEGQIADVKAKCIAVYAEFVDAMQTGREVDDILKYDSVDVLTSVMQRIDLLNSNGIFRSNEPPFGDARVRIHQIKSLSDEQQKLFVKLRLREIFERLKQQGPTATGTELRHVVFIDEGARFFVDEPDDIINVVSRESRKFGLGLWCAAQQPTAFPEDFLTNVGATILLGIHSSYWKRAASMLRITEDTLRFIKAKEVMSVKLQKEGQGDPPFLNVIVPNPSNELGRRAADFVAGRRAAAAA
jgi:hypothetical protein